MPEVATIIFVSGACDIISEDIDSKLETYRTDDRGAILSVERIYLCDTCFGKKEIHNKRKCRKAFHIPSCMIRCPDCI